MSQSSKRFVVVSNRLPVAIYKSEDTWKIKPSPGGLVTALDPTMRQSRGLWIGWPGCPPEAPAEELLSGLPDCGYELKPVMLTSDEMSRYYSGFANKSLWPLFHDLLGHFSFDTENWLTYVEVNQRFAEVTAAEVDSDSFVWIHDYQLILVARFLRELGFDQQLNFFLHIPFPSPDLFRRLPVSHELLEALLEFDHLGFQTARDRRNFIQCVKWYAPESRRKSYRRRSVIRHRGRDVKVGDYPISIDFKEFAEGATDPRVDEASWFLRENSKSHKLALGLDRLDYTKGIPERFLAFERALEKYQDLVGNMSLIQIVVPSRLNVSEYKNLKFELDALAGRINARFSRHGWIPIHYQFRELDRVQLLGHYRACDIALITPLRDGMNLVAKEYCAAQVDNQGALILSEFAGAAQQLAKGAVIVNPYDIDGTADAIYAAYSADPAEREQRMKVLRTEIKRSDVRRWLQWFLGQPRMRTVEAEPTVSETEYSPAK
ncbi:MAG: trehalose-6-phosphate synthase [Candidatus Zixiibacteriota bacterium]|nr:MAG: trehalose-6-phosphate synthase [candidate division Zixibacteria bacterium]